MSPEGDFAERLLRVAQELRSFDSRLSITWATAFLHVASNPDCTLSDLQKALGVHASEGSLMIKRLSEGGNPPKGFLLIEKNRRSICLRLSHSRASGVSSRPSAAWKPPTGCWDNGEEETAK